MRCLQESISSQAGFRAECYFASLAGDTYVLFVVHHALRDKATGVHGCVWRFAA